MPLRTTVWSFAPESQTLQKKSLNPASQELKRKKMEIFPVFHVQSQYCSLNESQRLAVIICFPRICCLFCCRKTEKRFCPSCCGVFLTLRGTNRLKSNAESIRTFQNHWAEWHNEVSAQLKQTAGWSPENLTFLKDLSNFNAVLSLISLKVYLLKSVHSECLKPKTHSLDEHTILANKAALDSSDAVRVWRKAWPKSQKRNSSS